MKEIHIQVNNLSVYVSLSILNKGIHFLFHKKHKLVLLSCQQWVNEWLVKGYTGDRGGMKRPGWFVPPVQLHLLQTGRPLCGAEARAALARRRQALLQVSLWPEVHRTRPAASQALHVRELSVLLFLLHYPFKKIKSHSLCQSMCFFRNCGLFKWERDGMLKVKHANDKSISWSWLFGWEETNLLFFVFLNIRRKQDRRLEESSSCLGEKSTASSSTASDTSCGDS